MEIVRIALKTHSKERNILPVMRNMIPMIAKPARQLIPLKLPLKVFLCILFIASVALSQRSRIGGAREGGAGVGGGNKGGTGTGGGGVGGGNKGGTGNRRRDDHHPHHISPSLTNIIPIDKKDQFTMTSMTVQHR